MQGPDTMGVRLRRSVCRWPSVLAWPCGTNGRSYLFAQCLAIYLAGMTGLKISQAQDWPQFLGPNRSGIIKESVPLQEKFPAGGPTVVWRVPGGIGMSGVVVSDDKCLTIVRRNLMQTLIALNAKSGAELWAAPLAPLYENAMGDGARATPTIDGAYVYSFTGEGTLVANRLSDGQRVWSRDLPREFACKPAEYGMASSPLVVGELVIVQLGAPTSTLVAVDKRSGKTVWQAGSGAAGYSSPALLTLSGRPQVVAFAGDQCLGIEPTSGDVLWRYPFVTEYECNIATPIAVADGILISAGENHGTVRLQISESEGAFSVSERWQTLGTGSGLRSEWQTPILLEGYVYGFDNVGSAGPVTNLVCLEAETGQVVWKQMRFGKSNGIAADGKLLISTMAGELVLVRASAAQFQELDRAQVMGKTRQAPTLADGFMFLRDDQEIVCVDLRR